ncbi:porin [Brevundimonas sp. LM2]|uniref:outer membrane protein n=1 Tax=Brevundimonas sp. LM2 TaxID=1938605 RepID=UPI000983A789|nr:outer membrane beta-barrel protein [Brevundimonas sp. LM2]AQR60455.1 porin [Brevundimonas sp. LM2]
MTRMMTASAAALLLAAGAAPAMAQSQDWSGLYAGVYGSATQTNDQDDERLRFDRNLDGNFGDTVTLANPAGADAFSPGSCDGAPASSVPAGGCDDDANGVEGGGRIGYDFQFGSFVVGAVAEYSGVNAEDSVTSYSTTPAFYTFERNLENLAALRARVGYAYGPALFYATGGGATGEMSNRFYSSNGQNTFTATTNDDQADGYQAGGGIEYALASNLSVTGEYIYTSLEAPDFDVRVGRGIAIVTNPFVLAPNTTGTDIRRSNGRFGLHAVRIGMNYRF